MGRAPLKLSAMMKRLPSSSELPTGFDLSDSQHITDYASENWEKGEQFDYLIELLRDVSEGRVLPNDADATLVGPDPVRIKPTVYDLDHPEMARWSPEMTAAWIKYRTEEAVSRHLLKAFSHSSVWVTSEKEYSPSTKNCRKKMKDRPPAKDWRSGYKICGLGGTNLYRPFVDFTGKKQCLSPVGEWFELLCPLLIEKTIQAYGREVGKRPRLKKITPSDWLNGSFGYSEAHGTVLNVGERKTFSQVTFSARSIIGQFPAEPEEIVTYLEFRPWALDRKTGNEYRRAWHRELHMLLLQESPLGFPVIPGKTKTRDLFLLLFLKKTRQKPEARAALVKAIGFDDFRASQNIERFIKRRCKATVDVLPPKFGPAMAAAISETLKIKVPANIS